MKLPCLLQFRILKLAITSLFSRPYTTKFPGGAPYEPIEQFRGRPRYDEGECIGCGACAEVCPSNCIDVVDDVSCEPPVRTLIQHLDACICCGQCERYCPTEKGIKLTNEYDFVGFAPEDFEEKAEKTLLLCESCGEVLAPVDQLRWLAKRLGPLAFANPTLMLVSHKELAVVDEGVQPPPEAAGREAHLSIQCPKCRRKTALVV
ncbi:MAG: 4Fe-4S binding protein [Candidatus Latescibacteria bacterium]|nr:4Fe-4S binding protein [Candidatus Latescibacterota bacterium]